MAHLRLAFSPDSDDIFMFWPLIHGHVDAGDHTFEHVRADTEALNRGALEGSFDVCAISIANYPRVSEHYLLLPHGGSVGRNYGPVVVSKEARSVDSLRGARIGVPGLRTTAYLVLRALIGEFDAKVIPISPFQLSFEAVRSGEVEAALLIHEGRLTYEEAGMKKVLDLGEGWSTKTGGLPLPLGGNAIKRSLGDDVIRDVSSRLRESIRWSLANRERLLDELLREESRKEIGLTRALLDRYLAMYANDDTLAYPEDARVACDRLIEEGVRLGEFPASARIEWAP